MTGNTNSYAISLLFFFIQLSDVSVFLLCFLERIVRIMEKDRSPGLNKLLIIFSINSNRKKENITMYVILII